MLVSCVSKTLWPLTVGGSSDSHRTGAATTAQFPLLVAVVLVALALTGTTHPEGLALAPHRSGVWPPQLLWPRLTHSPGALPPVLLP
jgi:hypothetical protein